MTDWTKAARLLSGRSTGGEAEEPILRYEAVFCIFMAASVVLCRENPDIVYPGILYLFLLLLALNWAAVAALRRLKSLDWASAVIIVGNLAAITGIMEYSGGGGSNLWVLFLLPVYTACMILGGREVFLVTAGTISFNSAYVVVEAPYVAVPLALGLAVKAAVLVFAATSTWRIAHRDRANRGRLREQVAELERLEERLLQETRRAQKADRALESGLMMVGVAHDLSNVLCVVETAAEFLRERLDDGSEARVETDRILRSVSVGRGVLSHLLGHLRQEKIPMEPVDLNAVVDGVLSMVAQPMKKAGIHVEPSLVPGLPSVSASRAHLERLFLNLFTNAKDALAGGGTVRVRTERKPGSRPGSAVVRAVVEDSGPGLPPEVRAKLFTPFVSTKGPGKGTGMGLFLCSEIVHQHRGTIRAENPPEGGARFTITLPAAQ